MTFQLPAYDNHFAPYVAKRDYQLVKLNNALQHCTRFTQAVDIGAHCGFFTCNLAASFERVTSFEPCPDNYACLRENTRHLPGLVELWNVALGAERGQAYLNNFGVERGKQPPSSNSGGWFVTDQETDYPIDIRTLDSYLLKPSFIKIDVQGFELNVLQGGRETILEHKPIILIELITKAAGLDVAAQDYLTKDLGMVLLQDMHKDKVYGFPTT